MRRIFPGGGRSLVATLTLRMDPFIFKSGFKFRIWVIVLQCAGSGQDPDNFPDPVKNCSDPDPGKKCKFSFIPVVINQFFVTTFVPVAVFNSEIQCCGS